MQSITVSAAGRSLVQLIGRVNDDGDAVTITSKAGDAVLMSASEYAALEETAHLLRSPANAARILQSLAATEQRRPQSLVE